MNTKNDKTEDKPKFPINDGSFDDTKGLAMLLGVLVIPLSICGTIFTSEVVELDKVLANFRDLPVYILLAISAILLLVGIILSEATEEN